MIIEEELARLRKLVERKLHYSLAGNNNHMNVVRGRSLFYALAQWYCDPRQADIAKSLGISQSSAHNSKTRMDEVLQIPMYQKILKELQEEVVDMLNTKS